MTLTKPKSVEMVNLVRGLRQQLHQYQGKFTAKLGVYFKTVNRCKCEYTVPSASCLLPPSIKHDFSEGD